MSGCGSLASAAPGDVQILGESDLGAGARLTRQRNEASGAHPPGERAYYLAAAPCRIGRSAP